MLLQVILPALTDGLAELNGCFWWRFVSYSISACVVECYSQPSPSSSWPDDFDIGNNFSVEAAVVPLAKLAVGRDPGPERCGKATTTRSRQAFWQEHRWSLRWTALLGCISSSKPCDSSPSHQCLFWHQRMVEAQGTNADLRLGTVLWSLQQKGSRSSIQVGRLVFFNESRCFAHPASSPSF